jgi:peptidoglycan-associated lipoprotein
MSIRNLIGYGLIAASLALALMAPGCASGKKEGLQTRATTGGGLEGEGNGPGEGGPGGSGTGLPDVPGGTFFAPGLDLETVYFDYDSAQLRPDAFATLEKNAAKILGGASQGMVQIAGHCDERGTQEYNLALGERRALAVREYLIRLGVPGNRLITISYGEETPAVDGQSESAWAENRRGMFNRQVQ